MRPTDWAPSIRIGGAFLLHAFAAGQPITRFILKEDQDSYYLRRKQLFETGTPQACELRMTKKDGTAFWARQEATAAQDADGAPVLRSRSSWCAS